MPRKHHNDAFKHLALQTLAASGNVAATARLFGINRRTLYRWQAERKSGKLPQPPAAIDPATALESDAEILHYVRRQILNHILTLSAGLSSGMENATLPQRAIALDRLLARLERLERYLPLPENESLMDVEYDAGPSDSVIAWHIRDELANSGNLERYGIDLANYVGHKSEA